MSGEKGQELENETVSDTKPVSARWMPRLSNPSAMTMKTTFKTEGRDRHGHTFKNDVEGLDIRVSRKSFRFALAVMDAFIKELSKRGINVVVERGYDGRTYAVRDYYDRVPLSVSETFDRVAHVPTQAELRTQARFSWEKPPKWDYVATGRVTLSPGGECVFSNAEEFKAFILDACDKVVADLDAAKGRRVREEAERRRGAERQAVIEAERRRTEALFKSSAKLHEYRQLLAYIEEVRRLGRLPADQSIPGQSLDDWLRWAEAKALSIHPLR